MDWTILIFSILDPLLARCLDQVSSEDPQEYLRAHYNAESRQMDPSVVGDAMRQTYRAIRKAKQSCDSRTERRNFPRYGRHDVYALTERRLIEAMNASEDEVGAAVLAGRSIQDEEQS